MVNGLCFTHLAVPYGTQDSVELVELDLVEMQIVQKISGKSLELLGGFHQPVEHGISVDLEDPGRASNAEPFSQAGDDMHDELRRRAFAMEDRAVCLVKIALARHT